MKKHFVSVLLAIFFAFSGFAQVTGLNETFSGSGFPPDGWTTINVDGSNQWELYEGAAFIEYGDYEYEDNYLITPQVTIESGANLSFDIMADFADYTTFTIEVSTTTATADAFMVVETIDLSDKEDWTPVTIDLSNYDGQNIYIAFHHVDEDGTGVYIDNVLYGEDPCPKPYGLTASALETTATISWQGDAASYDFEYALASDVWEDENITTESSPVSLTGLTAMTNYKYRVRNNCGSDVMSDWVTGTFKTTCGTVVIDNSTPYDEQFTSKPDCWDLGSGSSAWSYYSSYQYIYHNFGSYNCTAVSPVMDISLVTDPYLLVSFRNPDYLNSNVADKLNVYYRSDVEDDWTLLLSYTTPHSSWTEDSILLPNASENYQIKLEGIGQGNSADGVYVNRVKVYHGPACAGITGLTVTSTTEDDATITWNENESATDYTVHYKVHSAEDYTEENEVLVTSSTFTFSENGITLSAGTTYDIYVSFTCAEDEVEIKSNTISFNTKCGAIDLTAYANGVWKQDFENLASSSLEDLCFTLTKTATASNGTFPYVQDLIGQGSAHKGPDDGSYGPGHALECKGGDIILTLPRFTEDINNLRFKFWYRQNGTAATSGTCEIGVMSNPLDESTFESVKELTVYPVSSTVNFYDYYLASVNFNETSLTGNENYIAIKYTSADPGISWYWDDVEVSLIPACTGIDLNSVTVDNVSAHSATVIFSDPDIDSHSGWNIYTKTQNDEEYTLAATVTDTTYTLTNLTSETQYSVYVVALCNGTESEDISMAKIFTTLISCPAPTNLKANNITTESAEMTWSSTVEATSWKVYYKTTEAEEWTEDVATDTAYSLTELIPATVYTFKVVSDCGEEGTSTETQVTFTTACLGLTLEDLPKTWDFTSGNTAGTTSNPLPTCWQRVSGTYPYVYQSYSGSIYLSFGWNGGMGVITPIDATVAINTLQVSVMARGYYGSGTIEVGVMTDPNDDSTFTSVLSQVIDAEEYESFDFPLTAYEGEGTYIAIKASDDAIYINELTLEVAPACAKIESVNVEATNNSATITLNDAIEKTSYNVYYRLKGEEDWNEDVIAVSDKTAELSDLESSSTYEFRIETICDDGENPFSKTFSFKTTCTKVTVTDAESWTEDFSNTNALDCWEISGWYSNDGTLKHDYNYATDDAITPIFDLSAVTNPYLKLSYSIGEWDGETDEISVSYRANSSDEWTELQTYTEASDAMTTDSIALPNKSATYQIKITYIGNYADGVSIDDLVIYNNNEGSVTPQPCDAPTNLTSSNVTETSFTVSWTGTASKYNVQLGNEAAIEVTTNTYTFNNLTAATTYSVKVQSVCEDGTTSAWSSALSVTTNSSVEQPCNAPTNVTVSSVSETTATINWNGSAVSYDVQLDNGAINNVTATTYTFDNLTANTSYSAKVRSNCGDGKTSDWVSVNFTTDAIPDPECDAPTALTVTNTEQTTATISWNGEAASYDVQLDNGTINNVTATTYTFENLTANTTYTAKVRSNCGEKQSAWVSVTFKTQESSLNDAENIFSVLTYPNPTTANATLSVKGLTMDAKVFVVDVNGRVLSEEILKAGTETMEINSENLPSGVYYIRVINGEINKTQQLIKK
ncbi:MAG: fibronectin type III domain-containing protein [Bacteroidales bacterium]|nr:fibronectin type III domain-containing protein [Bacteroidales bacterium]